MKMKILTIIFVMSALVASAQETIPSVDIGIDHDETVVVATTEVYNAQIVSQDGGKFEISFDLYNKEGVQPDVSYSVQLIRNGNENEETLMDRRVYEEKNTLNENQTISKKITYQAPGYLVGKFQLWLNVKNGSGLMLGLADLGEVELSGTNEFFEINSGSCRYLLNDEEIAKENISIENNDKLEVICLVTNNFSEKKNVSPALEIYQKSVFGEKSFEMKNQDFITFDSGETKSISFFISNIDRPQIYIANLILMSENEIISNVIDFSFLKKGKKATIENLTLDKSSYKKGDMAQLTLFVSSSTPELFVDFSMVDEKRKISCSNDRNQVLDVKDSTQILRFNIYEDCQSPRVFVQIKDKEGNLLDKSEFVISGKDINQVEIPNDDNKKGLFGVASVVTLFITFVILVMIFFIKKKGFLKISVFLIIVGGLFLEGGKAEALTVVLHGDCGSYGGFPDVGTATFSLNKSGYSTGETINLTGSFSVRSIADIKSDRAYNSNCSGEGTHFDYRGLGVSMRSLVNSSTSVINSRSTFPISIFGFSSYAPWGATTTKSSSVSASSSAGTYYAGSRATHTYDLATDYILASVRYTVSAPSYSCTGTIPSYATIFSGDNTGLTANTAYTYSATDTATKCQYRCNTGYSWNGSSCVAIPTPTLAFTASPSSITSGSSSTLTWTTSNATSCWAESPISWRGWKSATNGSHTQIVSPSATTTYNLECWNSAGVYTGIRTATVTVNAPASCNLPWGGLIANGASILAYQTSSVACGSTCVSQTRTCNNGTLSGSYTNQSCNPAACASCTSPWGTTIAHGGVITAYQAASVPCGSTCVSQNRLCNNGTFSGSYTIQNCSETACPAGGNIYREVAP